MINGAGRNDAVVTADSGEPFSARIYGFTLTNGAGKPFPCSYIFATAVGFILALRQSGCSAEWCSACATKTAKRCERQLAAAPL